MLVLFEPLAISASKRQGLRRDYTALKAGGSYDDAMRGVEAFVKKAKDFGGADDVLYVIPQRTYDALLRSAKGQKLLDKFEELGVGIGIIDGKFIQRIMNQAMIWQPETLSAA
jgi:hypothetical protein